MAFGKVLTPEEVAAVPMPSSPWIEPTEIVPIPTAEQMAMWMPDADPAHKRFRWEQNVQTGIRQAIELTLDEYRARHVAKIKSRNEYVLRKREETRKAKRQALLEKLLDAEEAKVV